MLKHTIYFFVFSLLSLLKAAVWAGALSAIYILTCAKNYSNLMTIERSEQRDQSQTNSFPNTGFQIQNLDAEMLFHKRKY